MNFNNIKYYYFCVFQDLEVVLRGKNCRSNRFLSITRKLRP